MSEQTHFQQLACLYSSLKAHFGQGAEIDIAVQTPLHFEQQHPQSSKQPDLMVTKGLKPQERTNLLLWETKKVPNVIFEITSGATWLEDLVNKSSLYMQLGVKEYFIFDPQGEFLKDRIQGLRLANHQGRQEYVPIAMEKDGSLHSEELGTNVMPQQALLRIVDAETESPIPWASELKGYTVPEGAMGSGEQNGVVQNNEALQQAQEQLRQMESKLRQAEERARHVEEQNNRNGHDSQRLKTLEAENAHLRVLLGQMQGSKVMR